MNRPYIFANYAIIPLLRSFLDNKKVILTTITISNIVLITQSKTYPPPSPNVADNADAPRVAKIDITDMIFVIYV